MRARNVPNLKFVKPWLLLLVVAILMAACNANTQPGDPFTVTEGPYRARLRLEPGSPRVGQEITMVVEVANAASGEVIDDVEVRLAVYLTTPNATAGYLPLSPVQRIGPGRFQASSPLEDEGTLSITANIVADSLVTPVSFPQIRIQP